jgi:hypothetical protein
MPWYGDAAMVRLRQASLRQCVRAAQVIAEQHRADLGRQFPPASATGEFPARRSGTLQGDVDYEPKTTGGGAGELAATVFYAGAAPYVKYLRDRGRLGIADSVDRARSLIAARLRQEG